MKKIFFLAAVAALAFVGCNKGNDEPVAPKPDLVYTGASQIEIKEGTNFYTINFTANANWEAQVEAIETAAGNPSVTIDKTKGTAGEQSVKLTFEDLDDGEAGRLAIFAVSTKGWDVKPAEGQYFMVAFIQGKVFVLAQLSDDVVSAAGGKAVYQIITNCTYETKKYEQFEEWAPATIADNILTFDVKPNAGYDARQGYVKFTVGEIIVDDEPLVERAYVEQEGHAKLGWATALSSSSTKLGKGALARLVYSKADNKVAIMNSATTVAFDMATGVKDLEDAGIEGNSSFVTDAAGNVVFANTALYSIETPGVMNVYYRSASMDQPKLLLSLLHNSWYSSCISNVRVYGDVTGNAVVCAMTDLYPQCAYWEIKNGVVGEVQHFALPTIADWSSWTNIIWNAERNGCVVPLGASADDGFLYMGYDGMYTLYFLTKDGTSQSVFAFDALMGEGAGSNVNFQCISVAEWNGKKYALVGVSTYFSWGNCPDMILFNITDKELVSYIDHTVYEVPTTYLGDNDGENAAADVLLVDEGENLGAYMVDVLSDVIYKIQFPRL